MEYFKFGRRYFKTSGLFDDGHPHHNGLSPLRNQYAPNLNGQRLYTPPEYVEMPYVSVQTEPSINFSTQFITVMNNLIEQNETNI